MSTATTAPAARRRPSAREWRSYRHKVERVPAVGFRLTGAEAFEHVRRLTLTGQAYWFATVQTFVYNGEAFVDVTWFNNGALSGVDHYDCTGDEHMAATIAAECVAAMTAIAAVPS